MQATEQLHASASSSPKKERESNIYAVQQDTQSVLMSEFIQHLCLLDTFRTSSVHHQERFVQAVCADLVCGNTRTARHVQALQCCNFVTAGRVE